MSTSLKEKEIQARALDYLTDYYKNCSHNRKIVAQSEATTIQNKRADGLIIWENAPNDVRVVSIEAKSANTINSLRTKWDNAKLGHWNRTLSEIILLFVLCLGLPFFRVTIREAPYLLIFLFVLLYFLRKLCLPVLQKILTPLFQTTNVLEQAAQYPGNEVWIAIGEDTFKAHKEQRLAEFLLQCSRRKVGILEIPKEAREPAILLLPKFNPALNTNDFLSFYKKDKDWREEIEGGHFSVFNRWRYSEAEQRYNRTNMYMAGFFSIFLMAVSFIDLGAERGEDIDAFSLEPSVLVEEAVDPHTFDGAIDMRTSQKRIIKTPQLSTLDKPERSIVLPVTAKENEYAPKTCSFPYSGKKYILKDQLVASLSLAKKRVQVLMDVGCPNAGYFWLPCSDYAEESLWCVYAYHPRSHQEKIRMSEKRYKYIMRRAGLEYGEVEVWYIGEKE